MTKSKVLEIASSDAKRLVRKVPNIKNYKWSVSKSGSIYYHHKTLEITDGGKPHLSLRISDHWNWTNKDGSKGCPVKDASSEIKNMGIGLYIDGVYTLVEVDLLPTIANQIDSIYNNVVKPKDDDVERIVKAYKTTAKALAKESLKNAKKPYSKEVIRVAYNHIKRADDNIIKLYKNTDAKYYIHIKNDKMPAFDDIYKALLKNNSAAETRDVLLDVIVKGKKVKL